MRVPRTVVAFCLALSLTTIAAVLVEGRPLPPGGSPVSDGTTPVLRPAGATGTVVVPERFLRRWDPVTVFFARDAGPTDGGPEDHPERVVTFAPAHPGAFTWLDARTLQFRPAEPWPPLSRFEWKADGVAASLVTLMEPPVETLPRAGAQGLGRLDAVTLTFAEPLDVAALGRMVAIELRPLPGVDAAGSRFLKPADLAIKVLERTSRSDRASYVLQLATPIPLGTRVTVHYRLSLDDTAPRSFAETTFSTAEPFRITAAGCDGTRLPLSPTGSRFPKEQALSCRSGLQVEFSMPPDSLGPIEGRNLVRLTPAVEDLDFRLAGRTLQVSGRFAPETLYRVELAPTRLHDDTGRELEISEASELYIFFPRQGAYLQWRSGQGIVERFGAQMVPIEGRGDARVDLRIVAIDPLDRSFWPFPDSPVAVDEGERPPGPGEQPAPFRNPSRPISQWEIAEQIQALAAAPLSRLVTLPLGPELAAASFGLDLEPHLAHVGGKGAPGTYLVGIRRLDGSSTRSWMRVQVTDLALSTLEEPRAVRFVVTSLSSGLPVSAARVSVEGVDGRGAWTTIVEGYTDGDGAFTWNPRGLTSSRLRRIVVTNGGDRLVLDPARTPEFFADGRWSPSRETWLQWTQGTIEVRGPQAETLCHIFTERPVYRPDETVHIKGWVRRRARGTLTPLSGAGTLVVEGPGDLVWRYPAALTAAGGFDRDFAAEKLPTGVYSATWENSRGERFGQVSFRLEAYRIPEFEVQLAAPDRTGLDREFKVQLTATYYAGGRVAGRPIRWRVTQFPYTWAPKTRAGFRFSSDARFSGGGRFESTPELSKDDITDADGAASLVLNPAVEPTAQPRSYVVEATVTGADDQTVTATRQVVALPPFVLALKVDRYLEKATSIAPEVLVLGPDGAALAGQAVTVRLFHRQWHSVLQASDFSQGKARYVTDVVDEKIQETTVASGSEPLPVKLPLPGAGVYVVEISAADALGRSQKVSLDLYAGGEGALAWEKPIAKVFTVTADKDAYDPGESAHLVLQSPFQKASALLVVEAPEGNAYRWVPVEGGTAAVTLPILSTWVPRLPVHVVLMRGRIPGAPPSPGSGSDLGRPATMASTCWLKVNPVDNRVEVTLEHPEKAQPGQTIPVTVRLADPSGRPLPGEVSLWLVDAAVLALGREQRLDPLPDFITQVVSYFQVRDTRNLAFGLLPFNAIPGGDAGRREGPILERATVRRNFKSVPYWQPSLQVGPDGALTVQVTLPDNVTVFKLRAKAASGPDRFGAGASQLAVRLPVIVQPALPRFVRPGDRFTGAAVARVVEGEGGAGRAQVEASGVELAGETAGALALEVNRPQRVEFGVRVPTPEVAADGSPARRDVTFRVGVERTADGARDAFEVTLPIRDDRRRVAVRLLQELAPGTPVALPEPKGEVRPGTLRRTVLVSDQPALVRMAAALDVLLDYPYGCTEQKLARARAEVALRRLRTVLAQHGDDAAIDRAVNDVLDWLPQATGGDGLVAYWPGASGYVSLTAWSLQFLTEAKEAGYRVDETFRAGLVRTLERALRSDYSRFIDGEAFAERAWALVALAQSGSNVGAYAAELARKAQFLDLEGTANVLLAFARSGEAPAAVRTELVRKLWDGIVVRLHQGREIYGGLQDTASARGGLILASETRTVAEMTRALARGDQDTARLQVLVDALVTLGRDDGWGSTNANAAALLALAERLEPPFTATPARTVELRAGGTATTLRLGPDAPLVSWAGAAAGPVEAVLAAGGPAGHVVLRAETSYVPAGDGSTLASAANGFVVSREALLVRGAGEPPERIALGTPGTTVTLAVGGVVEEHIQVVNPKERHYVAVVAPFAAGVEPLNPNLATAPPEARPAGRLTAEPTYVAFLDDQVAFYYDTLPAGTFDFYVRTRAATLGSFVQPAALAEMMYDATVHGTSAGARVEVTR